MISTSKMASIDYDDLMMLFNDLKKSIHTFHSTNVHLERSGVFSMREILTNCEKMDALLKCDYEVLWRLEHQEVKELRQKLESIPVEVVKAERKEEEEDFDTMPPLVKDPALPGKEEMAEVSMIEQDANEAFCHDLSYESTPLPKTPPTLLRSTLWTWPVAYNPVSALAYNQQIRDL